MDKCCSTETLKRHGIRKTTQRSEVLDQIINLKKVFTVNDIFDLVSKRIDINLATVYRIVNLFAVKQIIREVINSGGFQYFELSCMHNPVHPHFICELCNKVECLDPVYLNQILSSIDCPEAARINTISINLSGICNTCIKDESSD